MEPLKLNLQHFADDDTTESEDVEMTEKQEQESEQENATYPRPDVDSEVSKAAEKPLKRREQKHQ